MNARARKFFRELEKLGCAIEKRNRSGHVKITLPNGRAVFTGGTPGDGKWEMNVKQDMRKEGMEI